MPIVFCLPFRLAGFALLAVFCFALLGAGFALPVVCLGAACWVLRCWVLLAAQVLGLPGCWVLPFLGGCLSANAENYAAKPLNGLLRRFSGVLLPWVHQYALCDCG